MHKLILFFALIFSIALNAEIYKWVDAEGNTHLGDKKPETIQAEEVKLIINTYTSVSFDEPIFDVRVTNNTGQKHVVMYSTKRCAYCIKARKYFAEHDTAYTEYEVDEDLAAKARYKEMEATGVPIILISKKRMNGFSVSNFQRFFDEA